MEFSLTYRDPLKANGSPQHKHDIRKVFHTQLKVLWTQRPLTDFAYQFVDVPVTRGSFTFFPLVNGKTNNLSSIAEIKIRLLRPEEPGSILAKGGDIDNRLKTLFDAFSVPQENQIPAGVVPEETESPNFYCLLEDDNLITRVDVTTDRLLDSDANNNEVLLIASVRVRSLTSFG